jgi:uncharacterized protein (DUF736 family)
LSGAKKRRRTAMDNDMTGVLFRNDKGDNEKRPDMKGNVVVNGVKYELAAWKRTPKAGGDTFLSLKLGEYRERKPAAESDAPDAMPF